MQIEDRKKNILIIEDNYVSSADIAGVLRDGGYEVKAADGIAEADELLTNWNDNSFDCLIIDLNMNNTHLPDDLKDKTLGGVLTGWIWLYNVAKPIFESYPDTEIPKIIIYSVFAEDLNKRMNSVREKMNNKSTTDIDKKKIDEELKYFGRVEFIEKTKPNSFLEDFNKVINKGN